MAYININETYRYMEKNIIKAQSHKDPNKCCKTLVFPLPKMQKCMYNEVPNYSQVSNPENVSENT